MSTLPVFQFGAPASASQLMTAFNTLRSQGQAVLDALVNYRTASLVDFGQKVEALNSRRQRANRVKAPFTAAEFIISDFLDLDQTNTSATVRADSQAVTLQEKATETNAVIQSQGFATSDGTAEPIATDNSLYRVQTTDGSTPVGTFTLELLESLEMSVLTFDLAAMPPTPSFVVSASSDGATYVQASQVSMNGYRLTAWFPLMKMRFITVAITPAAPDTLGGDSYTFGLTDFVGAETEFQLVSDLVVGPVSFNPVGSQLILNAPSDNSLLYFLSFNGAPWQEFNDGDTVTIPGTAAVSTPGVAVNGQLVFSQVLPATTYLDSVSVVDATTGKSVRVAPGLATAGIPAGRLTHDYIAVQPGAAPIYVPASTTQNPQAKTFNLSYVTGPASVSVRLKVQLSTSDRTVTPTFTGASLQEI